jgi:hypothetical protein
MGLTGAVGPIGPIGLTGAVGPIGATGAQGLKGDTGAAGTNGVSNWVRVVGTPSSSNKLAKTVTASCGSQKLLGGGATTDNPNKVLISTSYPSTDNTWTADGVSDSAAYVLTAYAICATVN